MSINNYTIIKVDTIESTMTNNKEMIKQFISLYLTQSRVDFQAIKTAIDKKDHAEISSKAHHIKPTMEYIGASDLRIKFQELETLGKQKAEITVISEIFTKLEKTFEILLQELNSYYEHINSPHAD